MGILVIFLGVAGFAGFGEDQFLLPLADCIPGTSELIGEDLNVIIRLDASQLMS